MSGSTTGSRLRGYRTFLVCLAVGVSVGWFAGAHGRRAWARAYWAWHDEPHWPRVERLALEVDATRAGALAVRADLELSGLTGNSFHLLLNGDLDVRRATFDGRAIDVRPMAALDAPYHREARVLAFELGAIPDGGTGRLDLAYDGPAARGRKGPDWRGILFVDEDEVRMCEQGVFWPQVPSALDSPSVERAPYTLEVSAPDDWELYVPADLELHDGGRWRFVRDVAGLPAILGGRRVRHASVHDGTNIVALMREEHADLGAAMIDETARVLTSLTERFGPSGSPGVGIVEIACRDSSYNWTAEGVMAFDRHALGDEVPIAKVAHESAHLWWGQAVDARGPGERFLCEGLAEFSAWSYLRESGRVAEYRRKLERARDAVGGLTDRRRSLPMREVDFRSRDYVTLAYTKGALVFTCLEGQLPPGALDDALESLVGLGADREVTLDDLLERIAVAASAPGLRVPWIDGDGDLALELLEVAPGSGSTTIRIGAAAVPTEADIDARGAPLAVEFGWPGGSERRTVLLDGPVTEIELEHAGHELAWVRLDPEDAWTVGVSGALHVLDGARLVESEPRAGAQVPHGGDELRLRFDRPLATVELEQLLGSVPPGSRAFELHAIDLDESGHELIVATAPWPPGRSLHLPLHDLRDRDGMPVAASGFALEVLPSTDDRAPRVVASAPEVGATVPAPGGTLELVLTFDEPMRSGQAITREGVEDIRSLGLRYPELDGFGRWSADARTITYTAIELEPGGRYALPIRARGFRDLTGNPCEDFDLVFTVADAPGDD